MAKVLKSRGLAIRRNDLVEVGDITLPLRDPAGVQAVAADVITEARALHTPRLPLSLDMSEAGETAEVVNVLASDAPRLQKLLPAFCRLVKRVP